MLGHVHRGDFIFWEVWGFGTFYNFFGGAFRISFYTRALTGSHDSVYTILEATTVFYQTVAPKLD